jgi:hypothetical protein
LRWPKGKASLSFKTRGHPRREFESDASNIPICVGTQQEEEWLVARFKGLMAKSVLVFLFLSLTATPLAALWATDLGASPASAAPGGHKGRGGNSTGPSCKGDSHVVVKPVEGIDDVYLNDEYGTETVRKFYGTDIWVLEAPDKKGAKNIVKDMLKSNDIIWAESGQFSNSEVTPNMVSAVLVSI